MILRRCTKTLGHVENGNDKAKVKDCSVTSRIFGATLSDIAGFSEADEHDLLFYNQLPAAHKQDQKQSTTFISRVFHPNVAFLLQKLSGMRSIVCEQHPLRFKYFLLTDTPQTETISAPGKKMYLSTLRLSSYDPADRKGFLTSCTTALAQSVSVRLISTLA